MHLPHFVSMHLWSSMQHSKKVAQICNALQICRYFIFRISALTDFQKILSTHFFEVVFRPYFFCCIVFDPLQYFIKFFLALKEFEANLF